MRARARNTSKHTDRARLLLGTDGQHTKIKTIADKQRAAAESQAKQKSGYTHVVEAGQTISAIAQAYKVSVTSIMKANKIKDATKIRVGQELFIPDP